MIFSFILAAVMSALPAPNGSVETLTVDLIEQNVVIGDGPFGPYPIVNTITIKDEKGKAIWRFEHANARGIVVQEVGPEFWIMIERDHQLVMIIRSRSYQLKRLIRRDPPPEPEPTKHEA